MKIIPFGRKKFLHHIILDAKIIQILDFIMQNYEKEFTVLFHCTKKEETKEYKFEKMFIPYQTNTSVHTEIDGDDMVKLLKEGADLTKLNGHLHTHPSMDVNPSSTDEKEIKERANAGFSASVILNEKGEMYGHICDMDEGFIKDVPIYVDYPEKLSNEFDAVWTEAQKRDKLKEEYDKLLKHYKNFSIDQLKLKLNTLAENIDVIVKDETIDLQDFFQYHNPLRHKDKKKLLEVIKERFKDEVTFGYGVYNGYGNKNFGNTKVWNRETGRYEIEQPAYKNNWMDEEEDDDDFFDDEEITDGLTDIEILNRDINSLTEAQYKRFEQLTLFT